VTSFTVASYPVTPGVQVTLSASASDPNGGPLEYRFDLGDGSAKTAWSPIAAIGATYAAPGHYRATVQVRDPNGSIASETLSVTVLVPPAGARPTNSSQLVCDGAARRVWTVNPDADTVSAIDADDLDTLVEVPVCDDPRSIARAASGQLWVACHDDDRLRVLDATGTPVASLPTGYGSAPVGIAASPDGATLYVALEGAGALARFSAASMLETGRLALGAPPRAVAVSATGARVLVTRFVSPNDRGEVWDVNAAALTLTRTLVVPKFGGDENQDSTAGGHGVANYLAAIAIAPDGRSAWVAANKANSERGLLTGPDLDQDNSVRNIVAQLDLTGNVLARAIDIDNSDSASALTFSPLGDYLLVTLQGNNEAVVFDTLAIDGGAGLGGFVTRLATGLAPQGACADALTNRTFVGNFMGRSLTVLETDELFRSGELSVASASVPTVASETLPADVLAGKRIFYDAGDPRMSAEGYISCATCHVDGGHDGRIWDFSGRGEGLRNTVTLHGRGGTAHGNVHWSANFDEIQDFENDIRGAFGGSGFLSDADFAVRGAPLGLPKAGRSADLDALAAYVGSLGVESVPRSPWRNPDGSMTASALAGASLFTSLGCPGCHSGLRFTDSTVGTATLHDVGTLRTTSGDRLGGPLTGIDTPSLLGMWDTAPYFHDGSAATFDAVFRVAGGEVIPAEAGSVSGGASLVSQWVDLNNDGTVRGLAYVALSNSSGRLTLLNVDGGSGGTGAIEVRYSSGYGVFTLVASVNGTPHSVSLPLLGNDPGWRHVNWGRVRIENVALAAGATNTIVLSTSNSSANISLDEIVVSTAGDLAAAQPHRQALALSAGDRANLIAYLRQLDGVPAQGPLPTTTPTMTSPAGTPTPTPIPGRFSVGGRVRRAGSGTALAGATITLVGSAGGSTQTGADGTYAFTNLEPGSWTIRAARLGDDSGALSTVDVTWALQTAVGMRQLSGQQALACDVTGDGRVTSLDAARLLQRLAGNTQRFPVAQACGSDWLFVPAPGAPGAVAPVIGSGQCTPAALALTLGPSSTTGDFDAAVFGDCTQ
jgi:hypothetical protein